jgi:elongation factor Ts
MMECKRALQETNGDLEAARTLLRERGMAQAGKRADRATTEGVVAFSQTDDRTTMVAVGCETEPVSKNDEFQAFARTVLQTVDSDGPDAVESLDPQRVELHPPANKIGVIVKLEGGTPELARQLAMHISFAAPAWVTKDDAPAEAVEAERQIYLNSDELEGKPEAAKEKIVEGMLAKRFFAAQPGGALTEQPWIHDASQTVGKAVEAAGARVVAFKRLSVAE